MKATHQQQHGTSQYHYGKAEITRGASKASGARKPADGKAMGPHMGRKAMPGDAHKAMRGC